MSIFMHFKLQIQLRGKADNPSGFVVLLEIKPLILSQKDLGKEGSINILSFYLTRTGHTMICYPCRHNKSGLPVSREA